MNPKAEAAQIESHASNAPGWEKLCNQLIADNYRMRDERDAALDQARGVSDIYRALLKSHIEALRELSQWRRVARTVDLTLPPYKEQGA